MVSSCFLIKTVRAFSSPKRGIGVGMKLGIKNARYPNLFFFPIDLPAKMRIIDDSLKYIKDYDIVIGSKGIDTAEHMMPLTRLIPSLMYNLLLRIFFNIKAKDTQGFMMFRKSEIKKIKKFLTSDTSFMLTQVVIYGELFRLKIAEIPMFAGPEREDSKINPLADGFLMMLDIIHEYPRFFRARRMKHNLA